MDYAAILKDAKEKLEVLAKRREVMDREIEALMRIIEGAQIATQDPAHWDPDNPAWVPRRLSENEPQGVTDSIRKILRRASSPLLPTEIRDALEDLGIQGSSAKNLLIHVHKALGRLADNGEVGATPRDGKMAYRLFHQMERQMRSLLEFTEIPAPLTGSQKNSLGAFPKPLKRGELPMDPPPSEIRSGNDYPGKAKKG